MSYRAAAAEIAFGVAAFAGFGALLATAPTVYMESYTTYDCGTTPAPSPMPTPAPANCVPTTYNSYPASEIIRRGGEIICLLGGVAGVGIGAANIDLSSSQREFTRRYSAG